jgi:hypothetical protein
MKVAHTLSLAALALGMASSAHAAVPAGTTGKVVVPLTLNFVTDPITTFSGSLSSIRCTLTLTSDDALGKSDTLTVAAKVSGKSATCDITMAYLWHVLNKNSHMTIGYTVAATGVTNTGVLTATRVASGTLDKIVLPANGATTTYKAIGLTL